MPMPNINEQSKQILETRSEYKQSVEAMTSLHEKVKAENRDFTEAEDKEFQEHSTRANSLNKDIEKLEQIYLHTSGHAFSERSSSLDIADNTNISKDLKDLKERSYQAFEDYICNGGEHRKAEYEKISEELRDASSGSFDGQNMSTDTDGGYLAPHEKLHTELIGLVNKKNIIRSQATILSLKGTDKLTIPAVSDDGGDAEWIAENDTSPESKMAFKQMSITLNRLSKIVPISRHLVANSAFNITNIIAENLSISMANAMEVAYLDGNGSGKPFGIFNTTAIPTSRDISVGTTANLITYDGLVEAEAMLAESDRQNAVWVLSTKALAALRKLKNNSGDLIFQDSMLVGEPRRLLGYPILVSDRIAEDGLESGEYAGFLGNLKNYYIVDNTNIELFVYNEKYQANYAIGLQTDMFTGGAPVRPDAFVRIKAGADSAA